MQNEAHSLEIYSNAEAVKSSLMKGTRDTLNRTEIHDLEQIRLLIGNFDNEEFLVHTAILPILNEEEAFKARHHEIFF